MEAAVRAYQKAHQKEARDRLVVEHLDYVRHLLGRLLVGLPNFVDREGLESAGIVGLVEAANQFDPQRGVEFKTFAYHRIRGSILDELRRNCPLPQAVLEQWARIRETFEQLGPLATTSRVAQECGLTEEEVEKCLAAIKLAQPEAWNEEFKLKTPAQTEDPGARLSEEEQRKKLADAIEQLPERLRIVLSLYYLEELRQLEIGAVLNLSESRVSRLLARALVELRAILHQDE